MPTLPHVGMTILCPGKAPDFGYNPEYLDGATGMIRVSSTEFGKEVGRYQDAALSQTVVVTRNGRDRTVMISADEYHRLKRRAREALRVEDFSDADIEAVQCTEPSQDSEAFNAELRQ